MLRQLVEAIDFVSLKASVVINVNPHRSYQAGMTGEQMQPEIW